MKMNGVRMIYVIQCSIEAEYVMGRAKLTLKNCSELKMIAMFRLYVIYSSLVNIPPSLNHMRERLTNDNTDANTGMSMTSAMSAARAMLRACE